MKKKIVDQLRELKVGQSVVITGKKDTITQTCWRVQKEDGSKFSKETLTEFDVEMKITKEK